EPALERPAPPASRPLAGVDEGALRQIFGVVLVAGKAAGDGQHRTLVAAHQRLERLDVPRAKRLQQGRIARRNFHARRCMLNRPPMLDLKWVVANLDEARRRISTRGPGGTQALAPIEAHAAERKQLILASETQRAEQKKASEQMRSLKGEEQAQLRARL